VRAHLAAGGKLSDVAVLFRTSKVGVSLQHAFASSRLPFNTHETNLWETRPVRELICLLRMLLDDEDDDAFATVTHGLANAHAEAILTALHARRGSVAGARGRGRGKGRGNSRGGKGGGGKGGGKGGGGGKGDSGMRMSLREVAERLRREADAESSVCGAGASEKVAGRGEGGGGRGGGPSSKRRKLPSGEEENCGRNGGVMPPPPPPFEATAAAAATAAADDDGEDGEDGVEAEAEAEAWNLEGSQVVALRHLLDTIDALKRRVGVLQLEGLLKRCADALPSRVQLQAPPKQRSGTTLLNSGGHEAKPALSRVLESVREYEKARRDAVGGAAAAAVVGGGAAGPVSGAVGAAAAERANANAPLEVRARLRLSGLLEYLEALRLEHEERIANDDRDAITLCSMHASKGREWPLVFVARLNEGECPLNVQTELGMEEERRLCYVALSRARERLCLSYVTVEPGASRELAMPSRFLAELPKELLTHEQLFG
jgi:hypothetical protein